MFDKVSEMTDGVPLPRPTTKRDVVASLSPEAATLAKFVDLRVASESDFPGVDFDVDALGEGSREELIFVLSDECSKTLTST